MRIPRDGIQMKEGGARVAGMLGSWGKASVWALDAAEVDTTIAFPYILIVLKVLIWRL